jgi:hypothetical protein
MPQPIGSPRTIRRELVFEWNRQFHLRTFQVGALSAKIVDRPQSRPLGTPAGDGRGLPLRGAWGDLDLGMAQPRGASALGA